MEKNRSPLRTILKKIVRGYQLLISPWFPAKCRFHPSCSEYTIEAIDQHGSAKGTWLSVKRILKCHPFSEGGFDPVPPSTTIDKNKEEK
ncbi:membrane protein insertion efficiency factor YidD [Psychrosphaera ytuae]|uniref:Putative membrane protein insertion efficiency factor n=1 Tax=Psychrosphaera ytuae TaxID=2820710 RepID=A0A975DAY8_9GAMM|nr:membrane protein insertion efficiency factor YidD [Psychrosphaera ytuae]QTH62966.1 membrane protein insertion efficiency factor YidD [Psychrosphaera ytuae]